MNRKPALGYLEPLQTQTNGDSIIESLIAMIRKADLHVGDRLPPEIALAEALGVGRSTIREALNRWEGLGIIRRRRGDGTYLTARIEAMQGVVPAPVRLQGEALLRLLEVRRALEADVARKAARNANTQQRKEIAKLCDILLKAVDEGTPWHTHDAAFHAAVYEASGNPVFGSILSQLDNAIDRAPDSPFHRDEFGLDSFPFHRDLSNAILDRDAEAAASAALCIVDSVMSEVQRIISGAPGCVSF